MIPCSNFQWFRAASSSWPNRRQLCICNQQMCAFFPMLVTFTKLGGSCLWFTDLPKWFVQNEWTPLHRPATTKATAAYTTTVTTANNSHINTKVDDHYCCCQVLLLTSTTHNLQLAVTTTYNWLKLYFLRQRQPTTFGQQHHRQQDASTAPGRTKPAAAWDSDEIQLRGWWESQHA